MITMVDDTGLLGHESRRSFLKKGAVATGVAVGLAGCSENGAPDEEGAAGDTPTGTAGGNVEEDGGKALMFNSEFRGGAQFRVVSPVIEQHPDVEGVQQGDVWSEYDTRIIEYLNTDEDVTFFPAHDAEVEQGQVYELHDNFTWFGDDTNDEGIIDVRFNPVNEDEAFDDEDWTVLDEGGGKALVRWQNYRPGAVLTVTSGVVEWAPRDDVQGSDVFSEYNTRFAEWVNTSDDFQVYPANDAGIQRGANYRMTGEFDVTDPEGNLVTVELEAVERADGGQGTQTATGTMNETDAGAGNESS